MSSQDSSKLVSFVSRFQDWVALFTLHFSIFSIFEFTFNSFKLRISQHEKWKSPLRLEIFQPSMKNTIIKKLITKLDYSEKWLILDSYYLEYHAFPSGYFPCLNRHQQKRVESCRSKKRIKLKNDWKILISRKNKSIYILGVKYWPLCTVPNHCK